jgi:Tol biopolymer transport system component
MLFRRVPRDEKLDNNHHGTQGALVLANSDGSDQKTLGSPGQFPWASWSPDGKQFASLSITGVCIVDLETRRTVRKLERKGFFQQMTWSPDGQWLVGVANSYGTGWSIARMNVESGAAEAVNRVDCCTPDWFPDSRRIVFSWRPPGQKANKGYGWTQLWMIEPGGERKMLYAEDGRHVYGGNVSPDGRYVLFTGNMNEDGDPGNAGAPMGLMRVSDATVIGGSGGEIREQNPGAAHGPVLVLPSGWEPCWTASEAPAPGTPQKPNATASPRDDGELAAELRGKGWIAFSAKGSAGDWDLWATRPDGTERRRLTATAGYSEAGVRFSHDSTKYLFYNIPVGEALDNNTYGKFDLVICDSAGGKRRELGKGYAWAAWGPDGRQLACLTQKTIRIIDTATLVTVRELPRQGLVEQLAWSPDGKAFAGTANGLGPFWNIARVDAVTGQISAVSEIERYNCTPDWTPDSQSIVYSRGIIPEKGGQAELWLADVRTGAKRTLYAEESRHIYGGCISPDGEYALFTRSEKDLGKVDDSGTTMSIIRMRDAPVLGDVTPALRGRFPTAKAGPRVDLVAGWEPHWTKAELPLMQTVSSAAQ